MICICLYDSCRYKSHVLLATTYSGGSLGCFHWGYSQLERGSQLYNAADATAIYKTAHQSNRPSQVWSRWDYWSQRDSSSTEGR